MLSHSQKRVILVESRVIKLKQDAISHSSNHGDGKTSILFRLHSKGRLSELLVHQDGLREINAIGFHFRYVSASVLYLCLNCSRQKVLRNWKIYILEVPPPTPPNPERILHFKWTASDNRTSLFHLSCPLRCSPLPHPERML